MLQTPDSYGSLAEVTWGGKNSWKYEEIGEDRKYIQDGDTVIMTGHCQAPGYRVGFGECSGKLLPAKN